MTASSLPLARIPLRRESSTVRRAGRYAPRADVHFDADVTPEETDRQLFDDERLLHDEANRFLTFAARHHQNGDLPKALRPILNTSGKRIRPLLPFWLARATGKHADPVYRERVARVAAVTLALHSAAIVIDDIEDGSVERCAQASLHIRNGLPATLNAASLLIFAAIEYLADPRLVGMAVAAVSRCHVGQAIDLDFSDPDKAAVLLAGTSVERARRWLACTHGKTAQLMEWSVRAAATALDLSDDEIASLADAIVEYGIGYQILDDVKNFRADLLGKKAYEDLPSALRNWVCLALFEEMRSDELERVKALYGTSELTALILAHDKLELAKARGLRAAKARVQLAMRRLVELTHRRSAAYVERLLDRPLADLREEA